MDWQSITFDWNRARAFLVTAEEGSLSAAARALNMTQPTIGRQIKALEEELGVVLFERVAQGLFLTPSGLELMEHVQVMGEAANRFSLTANGQSQDIEGNICISASEVHAIFLLPAVIKKLRRLEPKIQIEIVASSEASDLGRREADIAIRNFRPTQPDLIAKKINDVSAYLYATPEYINTLGHNITLDTLRDAEFINFDSTGMLIKGLNDLGLKITKANFPILTESFITHWELVKQGLGIGIIQSHVGDSEILVKRVLPNFAINFPIWLTTHREVKTNRRVRLVFDLLAKELAKELA
ncbi:MAG: DNA-binding transcriptional LysR family regulator [Enterobacterales bacterium]|jgi:DNA-binding transcriptional LysR family regulator